MDLTHPFRLDVPSLKSKIVRPTEKANELQYLQHVFKEAHSLKEAGHCLCLGESKSHELPITIRELYKSFVPARYPNTGYKHKPDCRFFQARLETSGRRGFTREARRETDGLTYINLPVGRGIADTNPIDEDKRPTSEKYKTGASQKRPYMTELGLLHELWEEAGANSFYGYAPSWGKLRPAIYHVAKTMRWAGRELDQNLCVLIPSGPNLDRKEEIAQTHQILAKALESKERVVFVAPISKIRTPKEEGWPHLIDFDGLLFKQHQLNLQVTGAQVTKLKQRFPAGTKLLSKDPDLYRDVDPKAKSIAIAICEVRKAGTRGSAKFNIKAHRISLMAVSSELIPCDSSHELELCRALISRDRKFRKPLRYDHTKDLVLPDFVLTDTGHDEYPMEVFGMNIEEYQARKQEKQIYYDENFKGNWWSWLPLEENLKSAMTRLKASA